MDGMPQSITSGFMPQQDQYRAQILVDRWVRDAEALQQWSPLAKECVEFVEGKQWNDADIKHFDNIGRPRVTINKINRLLRLVYGYYSGNRTDISFTPGDDSLATEQVAQVLSKLYAQETGANKTIFEDAQVFLDGMSTGRGFWDIRQNFERNDLGETVAVALDPFSTYLQNDADSYDTQKHSRISTSRWVSLDDIGTEYGEMAAEAVQQVVSGDGWRSFPQSYYWDATEEVTPVRKFGGETGPDGLSEWWVQRQSYLVDDYLKNVRILDMQYKVRQRAACFVDLETGDWKRIPEHWDDDKIGKVLYHAEKLRNPVKVVQRVVNRIRWTAMVGDIMIWDDWSPYDWFTIVGFFPYFRRGKTRGMLDDLLDPQREINKKRSLRVEILGRTANGGWSIHENSMSQPEEENLRKFGSAPGFVMKWSGSEPWMKPERLDHQPRNLEAQTQEENSADDLFEISGVNQSAAGDLDRVQSGKAILARQRQAVVGTRLYFDNWGHSTELKGDLYLNNFQRFYTEERVVREVGETGQIGTTIINQRLTSPDGMSVVGRLNDITLGRYSATVKQVPHADTYEATQFEEMLTIFESLGDIGKQVAMTNPALVVEMSTLPRKNEWKQAIQQAIGMKNAEEQQMQLQEAAKQTGATNVPNTVSAGGRVSPQPAAPQAPAAPQPQPTGVPNG